MVHDGDENQSGGDTGEGCVTGIIVPVTRLTLSCAAGTGSVGTAYSSSLVASGGASPYTFSIIGSLRLGLTLNTSTGAITGTPLATRTYNFTSQVKDSSSTIITSPCCVTIASAPLAMPFPAGTNGTVGAAYSVTVNASTGAITGTPANLSQSPVPPQT